MDLTNSMQWVQFIFTSVCLIAILIKIGNKQGQQDEKNKRFELYGKEIIGLKKDVSDIKEDVAYIKGKLL